MKISDFLAAADVKADVAATDKKKLLAELAREAAAKIGVGADRIAAELLKREDLGSTGVGGGVAIPHARFQQAKNSVRPARSPQEADRLRCRRWQARRYRFSAAAYGRLRRRAAARRAGEHCTQAEESDGHGSAPARARQYGHISHIDIRLIGGHTGEIHHIAVRICAAHIGRSLLSGRGHLAWPMNSSSIPIPCRAGGSPAGCSRKCGQPYRTEVLDYASTMKGQAYLAINPMGKVPALRHGDAVVTETAAICAYLADAFPQAGLAPPPGHRLRAPYYRWLFFAAGPIEAASSNKALGVVVPPERERMMGYGNIRARTENPRRRRVARTLSGRRQFHRRRSLCRLAAWLWHDVRNDRKASGLRAILATAQ